MDEDKIRAVIKKGENEEVEFKENIGNLQSISKVICSFANTRGGVLFIGVDDNGIVKGIELDSDIVQQKISSIIDVIYPSPIMNIEQYGLDGTTIFIVIVKRPADNTYYTYQGAIYTRVGSTTRRLEGQTQLEFLRRKRILSFDESTTIDLVLDDIDEEKVRKYLNSRGKDRFLDERGLEEFLINSRLATKITDLNIRNSAVLLFGKDPTSHFPQIEMKLVRFSGVEPVNIIDYQLLQDDIINTIEHAITFIFRNIKKSFRLEGSLKRKDIYEYPSEVVREAIVNSVAHRDYFSKDSIQVSIFADRLEITNPGSLPGDFEKELFGTISIQRNQILYHFLRDIGYVEGLGTGIPKMKENMRNIDLDDPQFLITENFFRITLFNKKRTRGSEKGNGLNHRQKKALEYLRSHKEIKSERYSEMFGISIPTAVKDLNEMIVKGLVEKVGEFKGAYYKIIE